MNPTVTPHIRIGPVWTKWPFPRYEPERSYKSAEQMEEEEKAARKRRKRLLAEQKANAIQISRLRARRDKLPPTNPDFARINKQYVAALNEDVRITEQLKALDTDEGSA